MKGAVSSLREKYGAKRSSSASNSPAHELTVLLSTAFGIMPSLLADKHKMQDIPVIYR